VTPTGPESTSDTTAGSPIVIVTVVCWPPWPDPPPPGSSGAPDEPVCSCPV
jgi:hypothetical protein